MLHVGCVERSALDGKHPRSVVELAVRRRECVPVKFVQNHIFSGHDPGRRSKQRHLPATCKCVLFERVGFEQPEVHLQRRLLVDRVELMRWCECSSNRVDLNEEAIAEGGKDATPGAGTLGVWR